MTLYKASWHSPGAEQGGRKHCYVIADTLPEVIGKAIQWGGSEPNEVLRLTAPVLDARQRVGM